MVRCGISRSSPEGAQIHDELLSDSTAQIDVRNRIGRSTRRSVVSGIAVGRRSDLTLVPVVRSNRQDRTAFILSLPRTHHRTISQLCRPWGTSRLIPRTRRRLETDSSGRRHVLYCDLPWRKSSLRRTHSKAKNLVAPVPFLNRCSQTTRQDYPRGKHPADQHSHLYCVTGRTLHNYIGRWR